MRKKPIYHLLELLLTFFKRKQLIGVAIIMALVLVQSHSSFLGVAAQAPRGESASPLEQTAPSQALITVDHNSIALFDQIPDQYIQAAANLDMLFIDRSVGGNINEGLDCLSYESDEAAPSRCSRYTHVDSRYSVDPSVVSWYHPGGYDRSNWDFLYWDELPQSVRDANGNCSSWDQKTQCFMDFMNDGTINQYDVVSYQFSYLMVTDGSTIDDQPGGFFWDNSTLTDEFDLEAFEAQHSDKTFIYWTTSLARSIGTTDSDNFNDQMRQYANDHGKILFDVADILSHDPDGNPCYDNRDGVPYDNGNTSENHPDDGLNLLAICSQYTTEVDGGHLGSVSAGMIRVSEGFWVLMAQIAGWDPGTTNPTPPRVQSISPADGATDVAVDASVVVNFSEPMNTGSVSYNISPNPGGVTPTWNGAGTQLTLAHSDFAENTDYTVTVSAGTDLDGNGLENAPYSVSFTTVPPTPPRVQSISPADGATDVAVDASVVVNFSEPMNTSSVSYNISPNPGGVTPAWNGAGTQLTLAHSDFAYSTAYTVSITGGTDVDGNGLENAPYDWTFTTEVPHADLSIGMQASDVFVSPSDSVTFTLTVANAGYYSPVTATVTDQWFPANGVSNITGLPVNCQVNMGSGSFSMGVITCTNVQLTAGAAPTEIEVVMQLAPSFNGTLVNQASVAADDTTIVDGNTANNSTLALVNPQQVFLPLIMR